MNVSISPKLEKPPASEIVRGALRPLDHHESGRAVQLAEFNEELGRHIATLDRGETANPAERQQRRKLPP